MSNTPVHFFEVGSEQREAAAQPGPGYRDLQRAVLLAGGPGHPGADHRLVLPELQVAPPPVHRVVDPAGRPALRAGELRAGLEVDLELEDHPAVAALGELAARHYPGPGQSQRRREKFVLIVHPANARQLPAVVQSETLPLKSLSRSAGERQARRPEATRSSRPTHDK